MNDQFWVPLAADDIRMSDLQPQRREIQTQKWETDGTLCPPTDLIIIVVVVDGDDDGAEERR